MEDLCSIAIIAGTFALIALQRYWKEKVGLFDKHGSGTGGVIALQEIVEPNVKHVIQLKEQQRRGAAKGLAPEDHGPDDTNDNPK